MVNYGTEFRASSDSGASWRRLSPPVGGLQGSAVSRPSVGADTMDHWIAENRAQGNVVSKGVVAA